MPSPYNYFASILQELLSMPSRCLTLDDLDSNRFKGINEQTDKRIHPEIIRRLKHSLQTERTYPILNPQDLAKVVRLANFSNSERIQLIAAIAATKIQSELSSRIGTGRAYVAAEKLLTLIVEAMVEMERDMKMNFREIEDQLTLEGNNFDHVFYDALASIERGLLILDSLGYIEDMQEKIATAQQADDAFAFAIGHLQAHPVEGESWQYWYTAAKQGQVEARRITSS